MACVICCAFTCESRRSSFTAQNCSWRLPIHSRGSTRARTSWSYRGGRHSSHFGESRGNCGMYKRKRSTRCVGHGQGEYSPFPPKMGSQRWLAWFVSWHARNYRQGYPYNNRPSWRRTRQVQIIVCRRATGARLYWRWKYNDQLLPSAWQILYHVW